MVAERCDEDTILYRPQTLVLQAPLDEAVMDIEKQQSAAVDQNIDLLARDADTLSFESLLFGQALERVSISWPD